MPDTEVDLHLKNTDGFLSKLVKVHEDFHIKYPVRTFKVSGMVLMFCGQNERKAPLLSNLHSSVNKSVSPSYCFEL